MTLQWVAIAASGAEFVFTDNPLSGTDSGSVSMAGSTITAAAHLVQSAPAWSLAMADTTIPVRFTFSGFGTANITNGEVYHPAAFLFGDPPSFTLVTENEAAPAPSATWTLPTGPQTEWSPNPVEVSTYSDTIFYAGTGVSGDNIAIAESYSLLVEVFIDVPDPTPPTCQEIGRATRAYVSAYDRARVQIVRVRRQEKRCLVANFNGAIPPGRTIVSATWSCTSPWVTFMSNASISDNQRETQVLVDFQNPGWGAVKVTATLDNGEVYNQVFEGVVRDIPWFNENLPIANGPYSLTATAP